MGFHATETYAADPDTVFALLCDPEVVTARFEASGDTDITIVRCEADGDEFVIESTRTVEVEVPGFAKKVLSPTNDMTQKERWHPPDADGVRRGTMTVDVKGVPATTHASAANSPPSATLPMAIASIATTSLARPFARTGNNHS